MKLIEIFDDKIIALLKPYMDIAGWNYEYIILPKDKGYKVGFKVYYFDEDDFYSDDDIAFNLKETIIFLSFHVDEKIQLLVSDNQDIMQYDLGSLPDMSSKDFYQVKSELDNILNSFERIDL